MLSHASVSMSRCSRVSVVAFNAARQAAPAAPVAKRAPAGASTDGFDDTILDTLDEAACWIFPCGLFPSIPSPRPSHPNFFRIPVLHIPFTVLSQAMEESAATAATQPAEQEADSHALHPPPI